MADKYKEPQICVFNNNEIARNLGEQYIVASCDLGVVRTIEYGGGNERRINMEYNLISNLHEYKIVIIDMQEKQASKASYEDEEPISKTIFEVDYPNKIFNPAPFVLNEIERKWSAKSLRIIFASKKQEEDYYQVEVCCNNCYGNSSSVVKDNYRIIHAYANDKSGKNYKVENDALATLVGKYTKGYDATFEIPVIWDKGDMIPNEQYTPLLRNYDDEVISYLGYDEYWGYELVLPVCDNKTELIGKLLSQSLPELFPELFPESKTFEWINNIDYLPLEYRTHLNKEKELKEEFEARFSELYVIGDGIKKKYQFLNDLLTETGNKLVKAVCEYMTWLGFDNVKEMDGKENILREDIQIADGDNLYIIEVKGIGGTSTDSECAQVAKHRRRREKENCGKNIVPIYIVNHQRYINPSQRKNPPFSREQIDYACNDERGLLTTWQLFSQFKLIEQGIFTKDETRECLCKYGLISLIPEGYIKIGEYTEYYKSKNAGIIHLNDCEISVGNTVYACKVGNWMKTTIKSLQLNEVDVESAKSGEVGIVTEDILDKGYELYIKK